jgi:putative ABC transport system substrate-binding protein
MRRREFIALIGGAAAATWPLAAQAEPRERMLRIGVLMNTAADDPEGQARLVALAQGLQAAGWVEGRNIRLHAAWGSGLGQIRKRAAELLSLVPDIIVAAGGPATAALQELNRTTPIVFAGAIDPVGAGLVASLARPSGNTTGFSGLEYGFSGKWLELLKEIRPGIMRVAVIRDPGVTAGPAQFGAIQAVASSLGVEPSPLDSRDVAEIKRAVSQFAAQPNGGLIVVTGNQALRHRSSIVGLAAQHRLAAVYANRFFVESGGLISYGYNTRDGFRGAAGYVDRILKGEKPADLPVQAPTKYELVVNLKTAKTLGLDVPATVLARADEVIE